MAMVTIRLPFMILLLGAMVGLPGLVRSSSDNAAEELGSYAVYCTPAPEAARVDRAARIDHRFRVEVVATDERPVTVPDSAMHRVRRGGSIEFQIRSAAEGAIAVHGLSELVLVKPDRPAVVRFRGLYPGRFPLHFHGADGAHYEIAALEVLEAPSASAPARTAD